MRSKRKFKTGEMVRPSSRISEGAYTKATKNVVSGYTRFERLGYQRSQLIENAVGLIIGSQFVTEHRTMCYKVKFLPYDLTVYVQETHLKRVKQ
jgi:hypothetical protein